MTTPNATVLVVDDDATIRTIAGHMLRAAGFTAEPAADGPEAVAIIRQRPEAIGVVLLDLTMPHGGGEATFSELKALRPGLPVVLMSGLSLDEVALQHPELRADGYLQKPFRSAELLAAVRRAVGQNSGQ